MGERDPHRRRRRLVLAVAVSVSVATGGCGVDGDPAGDQLSGAPDSLSIRLAQDYDSFDFHVDARGTVAAVVSPAYDRMVVASPTGAGYVPYLASSWEQTPTSIAFTMREDARCADGHVLTAQDAAASYQRWLDVEKRTGTVQNSPVGGLGPGPFRITVDDEFRFTFRSESPFGNMMQIFSTLGVICPAGFEALRSDVRALETATYGSGPYTLVSAAQGDQVVYQLRPEWNWGPEGSSPERMPGEIVYRIVPQDSTAANQVLTGELDVAAIRGPDATRLRADDTLAQGSSPNYLPTTLTFNMRPERLGSIARGEAGAVFREAVFTAVDPEAWNQANTNGEANTVNSSFRPEAECYNPAVEELVPEPSIERARQILEEGPFAYDGESLLLDGEPVAIVVVTRTDMAAGPDYLYDVLMRLGFEVTLDNLEGAAFGAAVLGGMFDIAIGQGVRSDGIPGINVQNVIGPPTPDGGNSAATGFGDPEFERLVTAAEQSVGEQRCGLWEEWQELVISNHYLRPLISTDELSFSAQVVNGNPITLPRTSTQGPDFIHWVDW